MRFRTPDPEYRIPEITLLFNFYRHVGAVI